MTKLSWFNTENPFVPQKLKSELPSNMHLCQHAAPRLAGIERESQYETVATIGAFGNRGSRVLCAKVSSQNRRPVVNYCLAARGCVAKVETLHEKAWDQHQERASDAEAAWKLKGRGHGNLLIRRVWVMENAQQSRHVSTCGGSFAFG